MSKTIWAGIVAARGVIGVLFGALCLEALIFRYGIRFITGGFELGFFKSLVLVLLITINAFKYKYAVNSDK